MKRVRLSKHEKERLVKRVVLDRLDIESLCGTPADVSRFILENANCDGYDELLYEYEWEGYQGGGYNEYLVLAGYKQETDSQYNKRIEKLKETKRKAIEKEEKTEKEVLKKLLKKYGNN